MRLRRAARTLALFEEARAVLAAFTAAGIRAVALKGLSLHARGLYADPAERPMNDVDLLVRPERARAASDVLRDLGYLPHHPALRSDRRRLLAYVSAAGDLNWIHRERPWAWVDLHWDLARCDRFKGSVRMSAEEVVREAREITGSLAENPKSQAKDGRPAASGLLPPAYCRLPAPPGFHPLGFPVLVPAVPHEILYLASHYAIFCRRRSAQTLEDLRRLLGHFGFQIADFGLDPDAKPFPVRNPQSEIFNLQSIARRWGVARALARTLRDTRVLAGLRRGENTEDSSLLYEAAMLDTWRDRARWLRRVVFPAPAWLAFAYGGTAAPRARHIRRLAAAACARFASPRRASRDSRVVGAPPGLEGHLGAREGLPLPEALGSDFRTPVRPTLRGT